MDVVAGFTFVFQCKEWAKKMLIGGLISSIPIAEAITNTYQMKVIKNIEAESTDVMPEWENLGDMFGRGFKLWLAVQIFYIPSTILSAIGAFLGIPFLLSAFAAFFAQNADDVVRARLTILVLQLCVGGVLAFLTLALPIAFLLVPVMVVRVLEKDSFIEAFNIPAHLRFILRHLGDYVMARIAVLIMLAAFAAIDSALAAGTIWLAGLGALLGWFGLSLARFWSRMMWAYYLAHMLIKERLQPVVTVASLPDQARLETDILSSKE